MPQPDLWISPDPRSQLRLLPNPARSGRLRRQRQVPAGLVDLIPPPPELEQLAAIAKELQRFDI